MKRMIVALALLRQAGVSASDGEPQRQTEGRGGDRPGPQAPTAEDLLRSYDDRRAHLLPLPLVALRIATWNTMLQPWLPYESRVINVIQNLSKANLDVIHLQEVWTEEAKDRIVAAVGKKYPYRYWSPAAQRTAGCFWRGAGPGGKRLHLVSDQHRNRHQDPGAANEPDRPGVPVPWAEYCPGESALL